MAEPGGFNIDLGGGGGGSSSGGSSGGSSSGGSSGGSSSSGSSSSPSGGSSTPPDPFKSDPVKARKLAEFQSVYSSLWGEPATEEYLKAAVQAGLNRWEFEDRERHKPAFIKTNTYRDQASSLEDLLAQLGVIPGGGGKRHGGGGNGGGNGGGGNKNKRRLPAGGPRG